MSISLLSLALSAAWAAPIAPPTEASPTPPVSAVDPGRLPRARKLTIAGVGTFGASYTLAAMTAAIGMDSATSRGDFNTSRALVIPLGGPFIAAARERSAGDKAGLAFMGIAQATGVALTVGGAFEWSQAATDPRTPDDNPRELVAGLYGTGGAALAIGLIPSIGLGASYASASQPRQRAWGRRLAVPGIGGFLAMPKARSYTAAWGTGLLSVLQLGGTAAILTGYAIERRDKQRRRAHRVRVVVVPTGTGAAISGRF